MSIIIIDNNLMLMLSASVLIVHDIMLNLHPIIPHHSDYNSNNNYNFII